MQRKVQNAIRNVKRKFKKNVDEPPVVILDVDETLILGVGHGKNAYNEQLIDALVRSGIKEVYLLTSFSLSAIQAKPEERERSNFITRLELIEHLEERGIVVKGLLCDGELATDPNGKEPPGSYYNKYIKPFEKLILEDKRKAEKEAKQNNTKSVPKLNLLEDKEYKDKYKKAVTEEQTRNNALAQQRQAQFQAENKDKAIPATHMQSNKSALSSKLFRFAGKARDYIFMDDRRSYGDDVLATAKQDGVAMNFYEVDAKKPTTKVNDYLQVLQIPPNDMNFMREWIVSTDRNKDQQMLDYLKNKFKKNPSFNVVAWREMIINTLAAEEVQTSKRFDAGKIFKEKIYTPDQLKELRAGIQKQTPLVLNSLKDPFLKDLNFVREWFASDDPNREKRMSDFLVEKMKNPTFDVVEWQKKMIKQLKSDPIEVVVEYATKIGKESQHYVEQVALYNPERLNELREAVQKARDHDSTIKLTYLSSFSEEDVKFIRALMTINDNQEREKRIKEYLPLKLEERINFNFTIWREEVIKYVAVDELNTGSPWEYNDEIKKLNQIRDAIQRITPEIVSTKASNSQHKDLSDLNFFHEWLAKQDVFSETRMEVYIANKFNNDPSFDPIKWSLQIIEKLEAEKKNGKLIYQPQQLDRLHMVIDHVVLPALAQGLKDLPIAEQNQRFEDFHKNASQYYRQSLKDNRMASSWREKMTEIRQQAFNQLVNEVAAADTPLQKLALLNDASKMQIFKEQSKTADIKAVFGRTIESKIETMIKDLIKANPELKTYEKPKEKVSRSFRP